MFSGLMMNTWIAASIVAVIAGMTGFFAVLRGSTFAAHAIPNGAFAGAAGASLLGINVIWGLAVFAVGGARGIGPRTGLPLTVTARVVGGISPPMTLSKVDLPAPLDPMRPTRSPRMMRVLSASISVRSENPWPTSVSSATNCPERSPADATGV